MTFGEGEKFRTALKSNSKFDVGCGLSPGHVLHPFLLALHTNLAADVAKLGVSRAHPGGGHWSCYRLYSQACRSFQTTLRFSPASTYLLWLTSYDL